MALVLKKEVFLANKKNKQRFINILGQKLEDAGCTVHHALGHADHLIVKKAVELSETTEILVSEDTDLLVLLLHYASQNTKKIFLCSEPKQNATRRSKVWDIHLCQQGLGSDVCESIIIHSCNLRMRHHVKSLWNRQRTLIESIHVQRTIQTASNNFFK